MLELTTMRVRDAYTGDALSQAEMRTVLEAYLAVGTSRELAGVRSLARAGRSTPTLS